MFAKLKFTFIFCIIIILSACGKPPYLNKAQYVENSGVNSSLFFDISNLYLEINWTTPLNTSDEARAILLVTKNGIPTNLPMKYDIYLWMPSMGHGSSPITIKEKSVGTYELSDIYFIMSGDWQLRFDLPIGSNQIENRSLEFFL